MRIRTLLLTSLLLSSICAAAKDTTAVATHRYEHPGFGERIFVGRNYRNLWAMPVTARIFHLSSEPQGFTIEELGGGMQTKSLRLKDRQGTKWVLRSLDKSVEKAMDAEGIRNSYIRHFSQQMISAANPYGTLALPPMAKAVGVLNTQPELVYIPDDPAFGQYRPLFANTLCLLELREPTYFSNDKVVSTDRMLDYLKDGKDYQLNQKVLLQARLLDMLIADWDRHGDQWKWDVHKGSDGKKEIFPIPRDHDQAFFNSTGVVFNVLHFFNKNMFVGFRKSMKLKALNYKEYDFDYTLLKDLTEEDWREGIATFQKRLTDASMEEGIRRMPPEVQAAYGPELLRILKIRRDKLPAAVMKYYHFIQNNPKKVEKVRQMMAEKGERAKKLKSGKVE